MSNNPWQAAIPQVPNPTKPVVPGLPAKPFYPSSLYGRPAYTPAPNTAAYMFGYAGTPIYGNSPRNMILGRQPAAPVVGTYRGSINAYENPWQQKSFVPGTPRGAGTTSINAYEYYKVQNAQGWTGYDLARYGAQEFQKHLPPPATLLNSPPPPGPGGRGGGWGGGGNGGGSAFGLVNWRIHHVFLRDENEGHQDGPRNKWRT